MLELGRLVDLSGFLQYIICVGQQNRVNYQELKAKIILLHILCLGLLSGWTLAASVASAAGLNEVLSSGCIDWSTGTVRASGIGAPTQSDEGNAAGSPAGIQNTARRLAYANLLLTLNAIRINAFSRVADRMARSAAFSEGLATLARNATVTHQEYLSDGTVEIELTMNLTGGFNQFVLPEEIRQVDSVTAVTISAPAADSPTTPSASADGEPPNTGLIIDASETDARPCLVPVVVDESGEVVYGPAFVSREFAVTQGMCGYATTLTAACQDKRVGSRPMVVKAIRTRSTGKTDLVISNADAARLRSSAIHLDFMKACRVTIVMNPSFKGAGKK
jgi:hypothetical protein